MNTLKCQKSISVSIDRKAKAAYFKVLNDRIFRTVRLTDSLSLDYGKGDKVVGVEIIRLDLKKAGI